MVANSRFQKLFERNGDNTQTQYTGLDNDPTTNIVATVSAQGLEFYREQALKELSDLYNKYKSGQTLTDADIRNIAKDATIAKVAITTNWDTTIPNTTNASNTKGVSISDFIDNLNANNRGTYINVDTSTNITRISASSEPINWGANSTISPNAYASKTINSTSDQTLVTDNVKNIIKAFG